MPTNAPRKLIITACISAGIIAPATSMTSCSTAPVRDLLTSSSAMDLLSPLVKDAANSYIANLNNLTSMLGNLDSISAVIDFLKLVEPTINDLQSAYSTLASTSPEERKWLWEAFGPKLNNANSSFLSQSEAITSNSSYDALLKPLLNEVDLFR